MVKVLFFAKLREALSCSGLEWELKEAIPVQALREALIEAHPAWAEVLRAPNVIVALNQEVVALETEVKPGDELAFYPPVTGG